MSGSIGWAKSFLTRSIGLEKRGGQLHAVLVDRPRAPGDEPAASSSLQQMRDELLARLVVHDPATQAVRHLFTVHKELGRNGWPAVEALPAQVLDRALAEAEMLQDQDPSPLLGRVIERLAEASESARVPEALPELTLEIDPEWETPAVPEVSETSYDDYEVMERSWIGTVPDALQAPAATDR